MKDNKYAPYILGVMVLVVWGLVFYKIYQAVYGTEDDFVPPKFDAPLVLEDRQQEDSYTLLLDYKDPFLGKHFKLSQRNGSTVANGGRMNSRPRQPAKVVKKTIPTAKTPPPKPFPTIVYQGFQVMESDTIALIKINNRFYPVARVGNSFQKVQVEKIYQDSIQLSYENQYKTFLKKRN
ncbi:hypothetical protein [Aureispira anguillae]|uniref:Uncharacterized protein n=1 Tax=Aureispira anguillae TaxID=2864201 RepID=A0A915YJY0_9BACT|nr:hypothetical protein [Aureispira anguillae]BDS14296.1 hypothetical protein AsAng_0050750 [Aureispira anguillae]